MTKTRTEHERDLALEDFAAASPRRYRAACYLHRKEKLLCYSLRGS